jgi:hypothetical protein
MNMNLLEAEYGPRSGQVARNQFSLHYSSAAAHLFASISRSESRRRGVRGLERWTTCIRRIRSATVLRSFLDPPHMKTFVKGSIR